MGKGVVIQVLGDLELLSRGLIFYPFSSEICLLSGQLVQEYSGAGDRNVVIENKLPTNLILSL